MPRTVRCYDCNEYVADLRSHRSNCKSRKGRRGTVECYDCHSYVEDLKSHRNVCTRSRKSNASITLSHKNENLHSNASIIESTTTMFLLLDVSGSMSGSLLTKAKLAAQECFNQMENRDRFSIVTFDTSAFFKLKPRPVEQLRRQNEIPEILSRIFTGGCTALYDAIYISIEQIHNKNAPNSIVVLTDGEDNSSTHTMGEIKNLLNQFPKIQLDIIHINNNGVEIPSYRDLCSSKGTYTVITTEQIIEVTTKVYTRSYTRVKTINQLH